MVGADSDCVEPAGMKLKQRASVAEHGSTGSSGMPQAHAAFASAESVAEGADGGRYDSGTGLRDLAGESSVRTANTGDQHQPERGCEGGTPSHVWRRREPSTQQTF